MGFKEIMEPKTARFYVRFTEAQKAALRQRADDCLMSMSDYVRKLALGKRIVPKTDMKMLNELRRQGGNLRDLLSRIDGAKDKTVALAAVAAFHDLVKQINVVIERGDD